MIPLLLFGLVGMNILALLMIVLRARLYKTKLYKPMLFNMFLSVLPLVVLSVTIILCLLLAGYGLRAEQRQFVYIALALGVLGMLCWLALLPNAGYLITELNFNHRTPDEPEVPFWYDLISILSLALSGVFNTCLNVVLVQALYIILFVDYRMMSAQNPISWWITVLLFVLVSIGIYLGRNIRFNSWDLLHPLQFLKKLKVHLGKPGERLNSALFVFFHSIFFSLFYIATVGNSLHLFLITLLS